ncbi:hypothetical protein ES332_D01G173900v1 [Gossypium tomentosum]|uniref:DUF7794 domain-containing protein n=1 Tax=Gossypium tomentosum TaxID=34277 RepID=A0A5D2MAB8_GOSTO|nr:hypothetical protein ES332_D01G173900v1 [Gossypium tomentosum]
MISLDCPLGDYREEEINEFASWLGGSYATDVTKPLDGVLTIPLANGDNMNLHMSKKVHREFASKLFALYRNIRKAMERHEDLSQTLRRPAELIMGSFDGIKHDTDGFDKQGMRLLLATLNRIFDSLRTTYEGFQTSTVKAIYIYLIYLHKFPLLSKSAYLQKLVASGNEENNDEIQISDIPGGPVAFEICAKFNKK